MSVRRVTDPVSPLLTEAGAIRPVAQLDLELQLARLAIMRGDAGMYRPRWKRPPGRLREDFTMTSLMVQAAAESLDELAAAGFPRDADYPAPSMRYCTEYREPTSRGREPGRKSMQLKVGLVTVLALIVGASRAHLMLADNGYVLMNFPRLRRGTLKPISCWRSSLATWRCA